MKQDINALPDHVQRYIRLVQEVKVERALKKQKRYGKEFLENITEEQSQYKYAKNKWTVKEVLQHMIDGERIFSYRALAIARGEKAELPGFDEKEYTEHSHANERYWGDLVDEFLAVRDATIELAKSMEKQDFKKTGKTTGYEIALESVFFLIVGHAKHHLGMIKERYMFQ